MFKFNLGVKSSDKVANFIQVPDKLREGNKLLGTVTYKGIPTNVYIDNDYYYGNLPMCAIGRQGAGKTTFLTNYAHDCYKAGESVFVIDFIKDCELSDNIKEVIPAKDLIEVDLSSQDALQGFVFNEIVVTDDMSDFDKLKLANFQAMQVMSLVDSINPDSPLTARMRRVLNAAANVVFVQKYNSLKNVIECLENHEKRRVYIDGLTSAQKMHLEDEIHALEALDKYSQSTNDAPSEVIGTCSSKVDHILDRIALLKADFKLNCMYNLNNNIDFVECMDKGKVVLLKIKESEFPTTVHKNILVTYFTSKLWLASQLRCVNQYQPLRCNVLIDEVFQVPTCMSQLRDIICQSRKFGLKFFITLQHTSQLNSIFNFLEVSRATFLLLNGCNKEDFNRFKDNLPNFQFEDLRDMPSFHAMCLVWYSDGYANFIAKLPAPPR